MRFWLHISILLFCKTLHSQFRFKHLDVSDGLSQNSVQWVHKDKQGYYWIGTQEGLNRYDGVEFEIFRHRSNDPGSISDNFINEIVEDSYGQIWVGTRHCLNRYEADKKKFTNITRTAFEGSYSGHNSVHNMFFDSKGNLYYSVAGYFFRIRSNELWQAQPSIDTLAKGLTSNVVMDGKGLLHFIHKGVYYTCNPDNLRSELDQPGIPLDTQQVCYPILKLHRGQVFIILCKSTYYIDPVNQSLIIFPENKERIKQIGDLHTVNNKIWMASSDGLVEYDHKNRSYKKIKVDADRNTKNSDPLFISISMTYDSLIWLGTAGDGLYYCDLRQDRIRNVNSLYFPNIVNDHFTSVVKFKDKYYAASQSGVYCLNKEITDCKTILKGWVVNHMISDKNSHLWLGTNAGVLQIDFNGNIISKYKGKENGFLSDNIFHVEQGNKGEIWAGGEIGLYKIQSGKVISFQAGQSNTQLPVAYVMDQRVSKPNLLWVAHVSGISLMRNSGSGFEHFPYRDRDTCSVANRIVSCLLPDGKYIWVGTLGGGIGKMDTVKKCFQNYSTTHGLCSDMISSLVKDEKGRIWIGTYNGLSCFIQNEGRFLNFTMTDGLPANEVSMGGLMINGNELIVSTPLGMCILPIDQLLENKKLNSPNIKRIAWNDVEMKDTCRYFQTDHPTAKLILQLSYPHLPVSTDQVYQYKLDGVDTGFISLQSGNRQLLMQFPGYGEYKLLVRMLDKRNRSISAPIIFNISLIQPFWKNRTVWGITLMLLFLLFVVVVRQMMRSRARAANERLEMERRVFKERERISRDLHDNIGSQLTYIISSLDFIKSDKKSTEAEKERELKELSTYARSTVQQLRDTIWALSEEKIEAEAFSQRVKSYLLNFLSYHRNIEFHSTFTGDSNRILSPTLLLNLFRIIQEAAQNVVKHSNAKTFRISYIVDQNSMRVEISDDGKGFKQSEKEGSYGLKNMRMRAESIKAGFSIDSYENEGTNITINCPLWE